MLINEKTALSSSKVVLVPYSKHHVPKYHEWMKDPDIQAATASEPLSLAEEYEMQGSWRTDGDKLTFIICRPDDSTSQIRNSSLDVQAMIGDVNIFFSINENENAETSAVVAELEIMIAEPDQQRQGHGRAALLLFLRYVIEHQSSIMLEFNSSRQWSSPIDSINYFSVKIGEANSRSMRLFESLGFTKISDAANYFGEYELRHYMLNLDCVQELLAKHNVKDYAEVQYQIHT